MKHPSDISPLMMQAVDALRRPHRNDLRQLAMGLRWLDKRLNDTMRDRTTATLSLEASPLEIRQVL
jgi:hypothetical protein